MNEKLVTNKFIPDLTTLVPEVPAQSILSRTVYRDETANVVLFRFAPGETLSEHTSAHPAILHFLSGEAQVTLGEAIQAAGPGTWVHMPAHLPHSITAQTEVVMLLVMLGR
jgi:quercetin dioxygenase-like cupin family protein